MKLCTMFRGHKSKKLRTSSLGYQSGNVNHILRIPQILQHSSAFGGAENAGVENQGVECESWRGKGSWAENVHE